MSSTWAHSSGVVVADLVTGTAPDARQPAEPDRAAPQLLRSDPAERGTLDVRTRAIQHIVERAVLDTPGTVAHRGTLGKLIGTGSPRATITMEGRRARVDVDVAAVWPCPVTRIATDVRERVLREGARLSGVFIRTVDVTVHLVGADDVDQQSRRVQ